jgi:hypothetical protein
MDDQYWNRPVNIEFAGNDHRRTITATRYAIECLTTLWPETRGELHDSAVAICRAALRGDISPTLARAAFIAAAREENLLPGTQLKQVQ